MTLTIAVAAMLILVQALNLGMSCSGKGGHREGCPRRRGR